MVVGRAPAGIGHFLLHCPTLKTPARSVCVCSARAQCVPIPTVRTHTHTHTCGFCRKPFGRRGNSSGAIHGPRPNEIVGVFIYFLRPFYLRPEKSRKNEFALVRCGIIRCWGMLCGVHKSANPCEEFVHCSGVDSRLRAAALARGL